MQILKALRVHLPAQGESTEVFIYILVIFVTVFTGVFK